MLKEEDNIELVFKKLPRKLHGYFMNHDDVALICLNRSLTQAERRCALAEELGHYFLGHSGNYFAGKYCGSMTFTKQEHDAKVWAADRLIDTHELLNFAKKDHQLTVEEIAERFWVTTDVLFFKLQRLVNIQNGGVFILPDIT